MTSAADKSPRKPEFRQLIYEVADGAAWIRLNRPEVLNAFSSQLYGELRDAVRLADLQDEVDIVVITGSGRAFGTGGDLSEGLEIFANHGASLEIYRFADNLPYDAIRDCGKVVIAAVNGICMAGGLITALSCDIMVAVESAILGIPEGRVGMAEPWVPNLLFGRISVAQLKYIALTGGTISAREAQDLGLLTHVVGDDELETAVDKIIGEVRTTTPEARSQYKDYINGLIPRTPSSEAVRVSTSPGAVDAMRAFAQRDQKKD